MRPSKGGLLAVSLALAACRKVPIHDIDAGFNLADATWFAEEQTLFVFYELYAEQGLGEHSVVEITYATDLERVPWTPLVDLPWVHTHVDVDCKQADLAGGSMCGSASLHVPIVPREVQIRLRYHREGELALDAETAYNIVEQGPAHTHRSLLVYGVFEETNQQVQWRSRHQFPTLRNERVEALGLRRDFVIRDQRFGTARMATSNNPYGYGVPCPDDFVSAGFAELSTDARARFEPEPLPLGASDASTVCAEAIVTDATGTFSASAVARKNPEVRPAFPILRSPVRDATPLRFFLGPCDRTISEEHEEMQRQRLLLGNVATTCTDDWERPGFRGQLVETFRNAVEDARPAGDDMVLVIALHHDEPGLPGLVEEALARVLPDERLRSSPRLAGAFVLDSTPRGLALDALEPVTLWCPSTLDEPDDLSSRTCATTPDDPDIVLGPFSFGTLPILPSRRQYLDFIDTYSEAQAGRVDALTFRTPEFATIADHVDVGRFGVATFLNNEHISADEDDAFSYCLGEELMPFVFRSELLQSEAFQDALQLACEEGELPAEICQVADRGLAPLEWLPDWHNSLGESNYDLGVIWDFPFLLRMNYEMVQAGAVSAFGLSVPFGFASPAESFYGTPIWTQDEFSLAETLLQCSRFCEHPTFDSAGVYHVTDPFRTTYAHNCYVPRYPKLGDSGFPRDP